jgi:hypothetical protein
MKISRFPGLLTWQSIGSMLPFSGSLNRGFTTAVTSQTEVDEDRDSVSSWTIQTNGCVRIQRAGMLPSKQGTPTSHIPASIVSNKGYKASFPEADLQTRLDQQLRSILWLAVALFREQTHLLGIILKGRRIWPSHRIHSGTFAMTGLFSDTHNTCQERLPPGPGGKTMLVR